jgi:RHS repeat-associated protein
VLQQTQLNLLGARGIEAVVTVDHTRGNAVALRWLLYDGHGNLVRLMAPDYTLSGFQWRGVWGEVQGSLGAGRGYCANLGHPEDETGLVYMRARYYEPATGRFLSEDPSRDGVNWYLYADGNPVNKVDEEGSDAKEDILWIAGNSIIIIGMLMLKDIVISQDKLKDYARSKAIKFSLKAMDVKYWDTIINFAWSMIQRIAKIASGKSIGGWDTLAKRWAGYDLMIIGQLVLTELDFAEPGQYDWWGWEVVKNDFFLLCCEEALHALRWSRTGARKGSTTAAPMQKSEVGKVSSQQSNFFP